MRRAKKFNRANGSHARNGTPMTESRAEPPISEDAAKPPEGDPIAAVVRQCRELGEYLLYYATAKKDRAKLGLKEFGGRLALAVIGFVALAELIGVAIAYLVGGIAGGISALLGDRLWAGSLVTGSFLLGGIAAGILGTLAVQARLSRNRTIKKYERLQAHQQTEFGHSVAKQPAASDAPH